jgi:ribulose-5-phosphate 4-epimerase/fuculose-1-phosphate aldolase
MRQIPVLKWQPRESPEASTIMKLFEVAAILGLLAVPSWAQTSAANSNPQSLIADLVLANHILANEGVLDGYGHVSVRDPGNHGRYFLARAGAPGLVSAADIIEYNLDSNPLNNTADAGYTERFIHGEIYKARPEVMAVVHCHCAEVIPFADTGVPLQPMHHMGAFIGAGVPVFEIRKAGGETDMLVRNSALGKALAQILGDKSAVLMRGHGATIAAASLHRVVGMAYYLNLDARLQWQAMQMSSKVTYLDSQESKQSTPDFERSWDYWKFKAGGK